MMTTWNLPALLDHTVLRPEATKADVLRLCQEAKDLGFVVIFVPPCYVDEAVAATSGSAKKSSDIRRRNSHWRKPKGSRSCV